MYLNLKEFDLHSFLIVFISFVGNAQVLGVDLVLVGIIPVYFLTHAGERWKTRSGQLAVIGIIVLAFSLLCMRVAFIEMPYFGYYYFFPYKALIITLIVAFGPEIRWPILNSIALAAVCLALLMVGHFEGGRFVSVFGPNMLYRVFGFLMLFSLSNYMDSNHANTRASTSIAMLLMLFGGFGALLTGSTGALVVISFAVLIFAFQIKLVWMIITLCIGMSLAFISYISSSLPPVLSSFASLDRLIYKFTNIAVDARWSGLTEIISDPVTVWGRSYEFYGHLWTFGYSYPHNILLELYAFFGLIGVFVILGLFYVCWIALPRAFSGDTLALAFFVLLLGASFSGDLSDNYGVLGLAGGLMAKFSRPIRLNQ